MALRPLARNVSNLKRLLEPEVQPRFRGNSHLLAVGPDLRARSCAAAYRGSNRRAFAASCNGSNQCAQHGPTSDTFGCLLASRSSGSPHFTADDLVCLALERNTGKLQPEFAAARHMARRSRLYEFEIDIRPGRHNHAVIHHDRRIQRSPEKLACVITS